jgi:acyl carrier protein
MNDSTSVAETTSIEDQTIQIVRETMLQATEALITLNSLLFYDLKFTSLDLLDLLYRLEERFGVPIPEGTLYALAKGDLDETEFSVENVLTPAGRERLMTLLFDSPREIFPAQIHAQTLPRYCTVGAFVRLLKHRLSESSSCSSS